MKLRVNLMLPEEHQQTGKARKVGFAKIGGVITACLLAGYGTLSFLQSQQERATHKALIERWNGLETKNKELNAVQLASNLDQSLLDELKQVRNRSLAWTDLLKELQQVTPPAVQLLKLQMNGRQEYTYNKTANTIDRFRAYKLQLSGKVAGDNGTDIVTEFVRKIPVGSHFSTVVGKENVHLDSLQRETTSAGEPDSHKFMMNINLEPLGE